MNHQAPKDDDGNQLVSRMRDIRHVSRIHVADLQDEAQRLGDWREYVRARPLLSVAAAAAVGFVLTSRASSSKAPQAETAGSPPARVGVASGVLAFAASLAGNAVREFAMHKIRSLNDANDRG